MTGVGGDRFNPDASLTWAEACQVVFNVYGDGRILKGDTWWSTAVGWAPVVVGDPYALITREELVDLFYKVRGVETECDLSMYVDSDIIDEEYMPAFKWAVGTGLVRGTSATHLSPESNLTRAQMAQILTNHIKSTDAGEFVTMRTGVVKSPDFPTTGQAKYPNVNGYYTDADVDISGCTLEYEMFVAINEYLKSLGLREAQWVTSDEMEEYALCRAKEAYFNYSHTRPEDDGQLLYTAENLMRWTRDGHTVDETLQKWKDSHGHNLNIVKNTQREGAKICCTRYKSSWALVIFLDGWDTSVSANNYYPQ